MIGIFEICFGVLLAEGIKFAAVWLWKKLHPVKWYSSRLIMGTKPIQKSIVPIVFKREIK